MNKTPYIILASILISFNVCSAELLPDEKEYNQFCSNINSFSTELDESEEYMEIVIEISKELENRCGIKKFNQSSSVLQKTLNDIKIVHQSCFDERTYKDISSSFININNENKDLNDAFNNLDFLDEIENPRELLNEIKTLTHNSEQCKSLQILYNEEE